MNGNRVFSPAHADRPATEAELDAQGALLLMYHAAGAGAYRIEAPGLWWYTSAAALACSGSPQRTTRRTTPTRIGFARRSLHGRSAGPYCRTSILESCVPGSYPTSNECSPACIPPHDAASRSLPRELGVPSHHCIVHVQAAADAVHAVRVVVARRLDIEDITRTLREHPAPVLLIHFFGFAPQEREPVAALCRQQRVPLIEDRSHEVRLVVPVRVRDRAAVLHVLERASIRPDVFGLPGHQDIGVRDRRWFVDMLSALLTPFIQRWPR